MLNIEGYENVKRIHFIGIGGVSMSAIAEMVKKDGLIVTGSDMNYSKQLEVLKASGIDAYVGHDIEKVKKADLVIYNAAIPETDEEYMAAKENNIKMEVRAEFLGKIIKKYSKSIAISGTHGKTTTTSFVSNIFLKAETDPTIQVGAYLKDINGNYKIGSSEYFVFESCEYKDSFLDFYPNSAIILNIDADHLDYFKDLEDIKDSFKKFTDNIDDNGTLVINIDDETSKDIIGYVLKNNKDKRNVNIITIGEKDADFVAENINITETGASFIAKDNINSEKQEITLRVTGKHNVLNALSAYAVSRSYGLDKEKIAEGLYNFTGVSRRFEYKGEINGAKVYDDYAHHPTEIKALSDMVNKMNFAKVYAIVETHTFTRTKALKDEFAESLKDIDEVIMTKIYPAREPFDPTISGKDISDKLISMGKNAKYIETFEEILEYIKENAKKGDLVVTVGAGTITNLSDMLAGK